MTTTPMCNDWMDIETAPKDGTTILARQGQWAPCHLYWKNGGWQAIEFQATHRPTHWRAPVPHTCGET